MLHGTKINGVADQIQVSEYNGNDASPAWTFLDGGASSGINLDTNRNAVQPQLTSSGSHLYAIWIETNGIANQIRVAYYDAGWNFIDGGGASGINRDSLQSGDWPQLTDFSGILYAIWQEPNGSADQIRVARYDGGSAWTFIDGGGNGINYNPLAKSQKPQLTVHGAELYATWQEYNGSYNQIRVSRYTGGSSWSFCDSGSANGINKNSANDAYWPQLCSWNGFLYAAWFEQNGIAEQIRMAVYLGGQDWSMIDGNGLNGLNIDPLRDATIPQITGGPDGLYAIWEEFNGSATQIRVKLAQ